MKISEILKSFLKENNLSKSDLAEVTGVHRNTVAKAIRGEKIDNEIIDLLLKPTKYKFLRQIVEK